MMHCTKCGLMWGGTSTGKSKYCTRCYSTEHVVEEDLANINILPNFRPGESLEGFSRRRWKSRVIFELADYSEKESRHGVASALRFQQRELSRYKALLPFVQHTPACDVVCSCGLAGLLYNLINPNIQVDASVEDF